MNSRNPSETRARLALWLREKLQAADLEVTRLEKPATNGFSTETLLVSVQFSQDGRPRSRDLVVRFENIGPSLCLDVRLQFDMISAMAAEGSVPVPSPIGIELDRTMFGAAFSVVGRVEGRPAPQVPNYSITGWIFDMSPSDRGRLWRNAITALASIHRVDWRSRFGFLQQPHRGEPGLDQLLGYVEDWYNWARGDARHPLVETALQRLRREQPRHTRVSVLWGDAAVHNFLFRDDLSVAAVLDWEAATLGPGEADLAWWLFYDNFSSIVFKTPRLEGLPDRDTTLKIYEEATGEPVRDMPYYELLAATRNAILSVRSVNRQVEFGRIRRETTAITDNPASQVLASYLNEDPPEVGEDFADYLTAVLANKREVQQEQD
jgi:aminoglycoside phosphotransferase (APT) family kinase protein